MSSSFSDANPLGPSLPDGVGVALVTPFDSDLRLDLKGASRLALELSDSGIDHFVLLGTTGEAPSIRDQERLEFLTEIRRALPKAFLTVGITAPTQDDVCHQIERSEDAADAFLIAPPSYVKPPPWELVRLMTNIADRSPHPLCLYHVPGRSAVGFDLESLQELAQHPQIVALKYADADLEKLARIHQEIGASLKVLGGEDSLYLPMLSLGARGIISVSAHVVPRSLIALTEHFAQNRPQQALEVFSHVLESMRACFTWTNPIPVKLWLHHLGLIQSPGLRSPLGLPGPDKVQELVSDLAKLPTDWETNLSRHRLTHGSAVR